ncbi:unnamed protein product [Oikopleura dioica]|uniref:Protein kinase domain-containing protein n=1 Tax=Oikopleura dioica TaxID=34765 RepID=E4Y3Z4_OIKDI|nr:unnamed protein product [Oikopleura dioica]
MYEIFSFARGNSYHYFELWYKDIIHKIEATIFQKQILKSNGALKNELISRSKIKEESGKWELPANFLTKIISEGGEALVFSENFGNTETAVRLQIFDPFLFTKDFGLDSLCWKTHYEEDFKRAANKGNPGNDNHIPKNKNVIRNYVNVELFHREDSNHQDCLGWITIMEKGEEDLRSILKEEKIEIEERKKIAQEIENGFSYLMMIGIRVYDFKSENIVLVNGIPKIIDFGLIMELTGRIGYRQMGYARKGTKYRTPGALFAATPGFATQSQITKGNSFKGFNLYYFLICNWKTSWTLLYKPIGEEERKKIDKIVKDCNAYSIHRIKKFDMSVCSEISSIISIPASSSVYCLDDRNLTKSLKVSSLKQSAEKCIAQDLQNATKNVIDQKGSNLCVPISVATLLRYAMKNDLGFHDNLKSYLVENILAILTIIVCPRSMVGFNLNPDRTESEFQLNNIEFLLDRLCKETYLMETGWKIISEIGMRDFNRPKRSTCRYERVILHDDFNFSRLLTVTGSYLFPENPDKVFFHQMVLDHVDYKKDEYVVQNNDFDFDVPVLRIPRTRAYYVNGTVMRENCTGPNEYKYYGQNGEFMWLVNEQYRNMKPHTWYLLPQAYSIFLDPWIDMSSSDLSEPDQ